MAVNTESAERALAQLGEMSTDLRGAAIFAEGGGLLAADPSDEGWAKRAAALWSAADQASGEAAEQLHIATERGEIFALRHRGLAAVAVTERFALSSLMAYDIRSVLRDLAGAAGADSGQG
jgi:predicted regulator of Ras-like GTPase activity (Roadblock/LC7/MglB family)